MKLKTLSIIAFAFLQGCASMTIDNFQDKPKAKIVIKNESSLVARRPMVFLESNDCSSPRRLLREDLLPGKEATSFIPIERKVTLFANNRAITFDAKRELDYFLTYKPDEKLEVSTRPSDEASAKLSPVSVVTRKKVLPWPHSSAPYCQKLS